MTIENAEGASAIHDELGALAARVEAELELYKEVFGPPLFINDLTSSSDLQDRVTDFMCVQDCIFYDLRLSAENPASGTWTFVLEAINPVDESTLNRWLLELQPNAYDYAKAITPSGTRAVYTLDNRHTNGIQLVRGITYRLRAVSTNASGGFAQAIPILRIPATSL